MTASGGLRAHLKHREPSYDVQAKVCAVRTLAQRAEHVAGHRCHAQVPAGDVGCQQDISGYQKLSLQLQPHLAGSTCPSPQANVFCLAFGLCQQTEKNSRKQKSKRKKREKNRKLLRRIFGLRLFFCFFWFSRVVFSFPCVLLVLQVKNQ